MICLGLLSCPKGHKSFGGSSGGGGGGVPSAAGQYIDIGRGWNNGVSMSDTVSHAFSISGLMGLTVNQIETSAVPVSGNMVRYGVRLTPSEKQMGGMVALSISPVSLVVLDSLDGGQLQAGSVMPPTDKSNYDKGYILLEFNLPSSSSGLYLVDLVDRALFVHK